MRRKGTIPMHTPTRNLVTLGLILAVTLALGAGAPLGGFAKQDQPVVTRDVFVHYPRGFDALPIHAGINGVSASPLCPDPDTCGDFKKTRYAWSQSAAAAGIHYVVDASGSGLSTGAVTAAVADSFSTWAVASTLDGDGQSIAFVSDGTASVADPNAYDAVNSYTFRDLTGSYPNAIGVTLAWHYVGSREIIGVDTIMNNAPGFTWSTTGSASDYDLLNIATHENGHWLQLGDLYRSRDAELTMYGYGAKGETKKQTLGLGDILGVQRLY
jgi:hypothetical protein